MGMFKAYKNIYELGSYFLKNKILVKNQLPISLEKKALYVSLQTLLRDGEASSKIKIIGQNLFLDSISYLNHIKENDLSDYSYILNSISPKYRNMTENEQTQYLEDILEQVPDFKYLLVSMKIVNENFDEKVLKELY